MNLIKQKIGIVLITLLTAIACFCLTIPSVIDNLKSNNKNNKYQDAIIIPTDTVKVGVTRNEIEKALGIPYEKVGDDSIYVYFRNIINTNKGQIIVVKFENDIVKMIDSNINKACN